MSVQSNVCSVKCPFGQMSVRSNVRLIKCPFGQMSIQLNVCLVKCPFGQMSVRSNVCSVKCPFSQLSVDPNVRSLRCLPIVSGPSLRPLIQQGCEVKLLYDSIETLRSTSRNKCSDPDSNSVRNLSLVRHCYWMAIVGYSSLWSFCQKDHLWWVEYVRLSLALSICWKPIHEQHRSQLGLPYIPNVSFLSVQYIHNLHKLSPNGCSSFENTTIIEVNSKRLLCII